MENVRNKSTENREVRIKCRHRARNPENRFPALFLSFYLIMDMIFCGGFSLDKRTKSYYTTLSMISYYFIQEVSDGKSHITRTKTIQLFIR